MSDDFIKKNRSQIIKHVFPLLLEILFKEQLCRMTDVKYLTFGCSFTFSADLKFNERWYGIVEQEGIQVLNCSIPSAGISYISSTALPIVSKIINTDQITHIILQKPHPARHPRITRTRFWNCPTTIRRQFLKSIEDDDKRVILEVKNTFKNAKLAIWRYWVDDYCPVLRNHQKQIMDYARQHGYDNWGHVLDSPPIDKIKINKNGCRDKCQIDLCQTGLVISESNIHPTKKHNEYVAKRVTNWILS